MNKMKKLLSVILAVVLALSAFSVVGFAAKAKYKTVADLTTNAAYSPYGQVTRLSTEERMSITLDFLDNILGKANINPGELFNLLGLSLSIDLRSVNAICGTLDNVKSLLSNTLVAIFGGLLGIVADLEAGRWTSGMTRENNAQLEIIRGLLYVLNDNKTVISGILSSGSVDLGLANSALSGLDLSIIADLPGLIKGLVFGMLERWDDTLTEVKWLDTNSKGGGKVEETVNTMVKNLFNNNMSITTVKYDANGTMTSEHTDMPFQTAVPGTPAETSPRMVYVMSAATPVPGTELTIYHIVDAKEAETLAKDTDAKNDAAAYTYIAEETKYVMEEEADNGVYVWKAYDEFGNSWALKWYNDDSQLLPGFSGDNFDLTTDSLAEILYTFVPAVFENMAPVVVNGSLKKILAEFFGAKFEYVGKAGPEGDAEVTSLGSQAIFRDKQGEYVFEWSDYAIIDGTHYYRWLDDLFVADLSATNNYFSIIDWEYEITADFMDEFVPANGGSTTNTLFMNLNNFLIKVANTVLTESATFTDKNGFTSNWTRPTFTSGDNSKLVNNIKTVAQAIISLAPQHIFGSDYAENDRCYYDLLMSTNNDTVLTGIAAQLVDILMPSMTLPGKDEILASNAKVGAILAAAIREFAGYLVPEYDFDALIYADFGTTTADPDKTFVDPEAAGLLTEGQTASGYWLDVILTMGINVGFEYIRAFADMGEDSTAWTSFVSYSGYGVDGKTYAAGTTQAALNAEWEGMLDYVIDWALSKSYEWSWKMENLVNTTGLTIDLATAQDPWVKLSTIFANLLPIEEILKIDYTATNWLEVALREDLILALVDLRWEDFAEMLKVPAGFVRNENALDSLAVALKGLVNGLFAKVGGGSYALIPSAVTDFDTLAQQSSIASLAQGLLGALETAEKNGLLDTVLPIVGMFIGWKTDPQVIADPQIWTSFRDGNDYAFQWTGNGVYPTMDADNTIIKILNNSSGMLETHRNSDVVDHQYDINIRSVTSDATVNTLTFNYGDGLIEPFETLDLKIGGTYKGDEAVTLTITYDYVGKDGQPVGGTQKMSYTIFISNLYEDANIEGRESGDESDGKYGIDPFKRYQFTKDIYTHVTEFKPSVWGTNDSFGGTSNYKSTAAPDSVTDCNGNVTDERGMNELAKTYFAYYQNRDGGWASSFAKNGSTSGKLYYAKTGVTADTEFPYGTYDMGRVAIKYSDDSKVWDLDFIYYNDFNVYDVYTSNLGNGFTADQVDDVAVYNEYNAAFKDIVKYATYPMMTEANGNTGTDYVKTIQPKIEAAIERFETALESFQTAKAEANAAGIAAAAPEYVQNLEAQLALDDGDGEKEIDFQDYEYYEYFNYADLRTAHRNFVKTYYAPEVMDTYYIMGSGIREAELTEVVADEANTYIQAGINASREENDAAAIDASIVAASEWKMPVNSKLLVDDMTSRLAYYKTFVNDSVKEDADLLKFLEREIAHVDAQQLNEADYTADSWAKYQAAYDVAQEVVAGTFAYADCNSTIYDAKYELMAAYKNLLLKVDSVFEDNGEEIQRLQALANQADAIFDTLGTYYGVKEGFVAEEAYAELIQALGYKYQAVYSKHDAEVQKGEKDIGDLKYNDDGTAMIFNLYADSAIEYLENDRPNRQSNLNNIIAAADKLQAAIDKFECTIKVEDNGDGYTAVEQEIKYINGIVPGSIATVADLLNHVKASVEGATLNPIASKAGALGTGASVEITVDGIDNPLAVYYVVIYGDVNGDGAIDTFDAMEVDMTGSFAGVYADAADVTSDGEIGEADYAAIIAASAAGAPIAQTK